MLEVWIGNSEPILRKLNSNRSLRRDVDNFIYSLSQIASPYYDLTSNVKAIGHPFFHTTQLLRDAGRFVYGGFVLVGALVTGNLSAAGHAAVSMFRLVGAAALEILNIALSIVSLATRIVASIFNFGYVSTSVKLGGAHPNGAEIGEKIMNMMRASGLIMAGINDDQEHDSAFTLI
jgi:hypothetical protein